MISKNKKSISNKILSYSLLSGILLPIFYLCFLYSLTNSCAQQQQLTGGPRDTFPPNLIKELSTPNFQTNFEKQPITLVFDEYIELRDVIKQVVVSPPLTYIPKVERKKGFKTAQFEFNEKEVLKEGVTYAINFGESIKDLTEGNEAENLQFLFSTGDYIDSLKMSGTVLDAITGKPIEGVIFMLYENFADTVVRTEKPYYFGKSEKDGKFIINYLKAGAFKGFALEDQDLNYLFNIPKERIGFTLDSIIINDSTETEVLIKLFEENTILDKPKVDVKKYGLVKMGFKRAPYDALITYDSVGQELYKEIEGDTIQYWYNLEDSLNWNFYFHRDTLVDTFEVRALNRNIQPIKLTRERNADEKIPLNPFKALPLTFNHPIKKLDTSLVHFSKIINQEIVADTTIKNELIDSLGQKKDSISQIVSLDSLNKNSDTSGVILKQQKIKLVADIRIDSVSKRTMNVDYDWKEKANYQLEILPGAITDWYNELNRDTFVLNYEVKPKDDFGTINLVITAMDSTKSYWFQLLLGENEVQSFLISNERAYNKIVTALRPGKYALKIIEDLNGNGRWDSGNYDLKLQPEKIATAEIEELRAGWDVDAEVKIDFSEKEKEKQ